MSHYLVQSINPSPLKERSKVSSQFSKFDTIIIIDTKTSSTCTQLNKNVMKNHLY